MTQITFDLSQSIKSATGNYYKMIQTLGSGKSATAYLALKTSSNDRGTFFVIKILQHPNISSKLNYFNAEMSTMSSLSHSSVLQLRDNGTFNCNNTSYPFYVCDFYPRNLSEFIRNENVKITQKLSFSIQLCSALAYLATQDIAHCDIKPSNIYTDGFKCVIADFGLARKCSTSATTNDDLPSLHRYRSPDIVEAIRNGTQLTTKSDVFQLGLMLTELFTGVNPCLERQDGSAKVFVDDVSDIYGRFGEKIQKLLTEMLDQNAGTRPNANSLIDRWQTILFEAYDYILGVDRNVF